MQERQPPKKEEARMAFQFFLHATHLTQGLGHKFFTFFDRKELLLRLGEVPDME
jgi:hypothetical protein